MKICPGCNIQIDGSRNTCPFCQNALTGEASESNWPPVTKFKHQALMYKIQLFVVLVLIVISLFLDFMLKLNNGIHYSLLIAGWGISSQVMVRHFIKHHTFAAKIVAICAVFACILAGLTAYYLDSRLFILIFYYITPGVIGATIIASFVLTLVDKRGNSLIYLLVMIVVGVLPYIALEIGHDEHDLFWSICMIISIIATLAIVIFRGKNVLSELQKRFNF